MLDRDTAEDSFRIPMLVLFSTPILVLFVPALKCGGVSVSSVG